MEAVAEHINEMQKIFEEYGTVFDELAKMFRDLYPHKKVFNLSLFSLTQKLLEILTREWQVCVLIMFVQILKLNLDSNIHVGLSKL